MTKDYNTLVHFEVASLVSHILTTISIFQNSLSGYPSSGSSLSQRFNGLKKTFFER